jgi:hypothetical protein
MSAFLKPSEGSTEESSRVAGRSPERSAATLPTVGSHPPAQPEPQQRRNRRDEQQQPQPRLPELVYGDVRQNAEPSQDGRHRQAPPPRGPPDEPQDHRGGHDDDDRDRDANRVQEAGAC